MTLQSKNDIFKAHKKINNKMENKEKADLRVVFWHNDFADSPNQNGFYGPNGKIAERVKKNLPVGTKIEWHFHGGFIHPKRHVLLERLKQADVLLAAYPGNMDVNNNNMDWKEAEISLLNILKKIREENKNLKVFFLHEPHHPIEFFEGICQFVNDIHDDTIYGYFLGK